MKTLQVGGLSSCEGRFDSDCITLFLYKLVPELCMPCGASHMDGGWGMRDARAFGGDDNVDSGVSEETCWRDDDGF